MYIGIDIGGTKCAVIKGRATVDGNIEILQKLRFETTSPAETVENIMNSVASLMPCEAIGVSCGGPLDEEGGVILSPPNLPGWDEVHITEMLTERFGVPAMLRNDANACALAEWRFGAGKGTRNMVFLTFGTGLGAGLIIDGKLYGGTNGMAGEVGHIRLDDDGPIGYGKHGSFEGFCSGGGIAQLAKKRAQEALSGGRVTFSCKNDNDVYGITTAKIAELAFLGDVDAIAVFDESARRLGQGLSIIIDLLNPEAIVIGSVYARCESLFADSMHKVLEREALSHSLSVCKILPAALGESIGDIAAISVAMEKRKEN